MRFIRKRCGMIGGCVRTSPPALVEIVGSPLQRRAAAYVAKSRHSRFAGNHDSPCAIFATPSRNALRRACPSHPRRTPPRVYIGDRVTQPLGLIQFLRSTRGGVGPTSDFELSTITRLKQPPCCPIRRVRVWLPGLTDPGKSLAWLESAPRTDAVPPLKQLAARCGGWHGQAPVVEIPALRDDKVPHGR